MWISRKEKRELQHKLRNERTARAGYEDLSEKLEREVMELDRKMAELRKTVEKAAAAYRKLQTENELLRMENNLLKMGQK